MAENKYLTAMKLAKQQPETAATEPQAETATAATPPPARKTVRSAAGRPRGKRSNPDWEQVTLFVRKDTKRAAFRRMMDEESGRDLSEVIEHLLAKWAQAS